MKIISVLLVFIPIISWARPEVTINSQVEVSQKRALYLGDIADIRDANMELVNALEKVKVRDDARELLISQVLDSKEILAVFRKSLSEDSVISKFKPSLKVPSEVKIQFATTPISKEEVERKVLNRLYVQCAGCEFKVSVQSTPVPQSERWSINYDYNELKGGVLLPLTDGDNRSVKKISANIRISKLTPVAKRLVKIGERVSSEDFEYKFSDITFAKDSSLNIEDTTDLVAAKTIVAGSTVWAADFKRQAAAQRGQIVKAILGDENFEITTDMIAEESGYVGDTIRLKSVETKKLFSGVVTAKGVVRIQ